MKLSVLTKTGLLACLGMIACNELSGTMTLKQSLNVVDKKGKAITISSGTFQADFEFDEDDRELELEVKKANGGKDVKLKMIVPAGTEIPRGNGPILLLGAEVGQNFDLDADLSTDVREGSRVRGTESCSYTERDYVCREVCRDYVDRDGQRRRTCNDVCGYEDVTRTGSREVEYHIVTTTVRVVGSLLDSNTKTDIGALSVGRTDSETVYDYYGSCEHYRRRF